MYADPIPPVAAEVRPAGGARVDLRGLRLGIAEVDRLLLTRAGDRARVHRLRMRIAQDALLRYLASAMAGGPVTRLAIRAQGPHRIGLDARAFGLPTRAQITLTAVKGRAYMGIESARFGWFPVPPRFLRDQIVASSEPAVIRSGEVRPEGEAGLTFEPDYLFSHVVARLPLALAERGLPAHLDVRLTRIALEGDQVHVEGGE